MNSKVQHQRAHEPGRGRHATAPWQIPWAGWKDILWRTYQQINEDPVLAVAAGVVFYCLLAVFPAITAVVSLYGLSPKPPRSTSIRGSGRDCSGAGDIGFIFGLAGALARCAAPIHPQLMEGAVPSRCRPPAQLANHATAAPRSAAAPAMKARITAARRALRISSRACAMMLSTRRSASARASPVSAEVSVTR